MGVLEKVHSLNFDIIFMVDFNINLLDRNSSVAIDILSSMTSFGLLPSILIPTCITELSTTLIDSIFSSISSQNSTVIILDISDHISLWSKFDVLHTHDMLNHLLKGNIFSQMTSISQTLGQNYQKYHDNLWMILICL